MKAIRIYTNCNEYKQDLKYWSNCCGELHHHGEYDITESELPKELQDAYKRLWTEDSGSYVYLAEYKSEYGLAIVNEYYEFTPEGDLGEVNNFERAVKVGEELTKAFPKYTVFIGKELGWPACNGDDLATELVLFAKPSEMTKDEFDTVTKWLLENAYTNER